MAITFAGAVADQAAGSRRCFDSLHFVSVAQQDRAFGWPVCGKELAAALLLCSRFYGPAKIIWITGGGSVLVANLTAYLFLE